MGFHVCSKIFRLGTGCRERMVFRWASGSISDRLVLIHAWSITGCTAVPTPIFPAVSDTNLSFPVDKVEEEVRRLGMGRLLDDLSGKMQQKADRGDQDPLKILVHSTHDTALAALCSTLDVFDEKWILFSYIRRGMF
jgi:hypothetical protein